MTRPAPWSLRRRLVVGIVALLAVVSVVVGSVSVLALRQNLLERLDDQVRASLEIGFGPGPGGQPDADGGPERRIGALLLVERDGAVVRAEYVSDTGQTVTLTAAQQEELLDATGAGDGSSDASPGEGDGPGTSDIRPVTVDLGGDLGSFRVGARSTAEVTVVSGQSLDEVTTTTRDLVLIFALVTLVALAVAALVGALVVRLALRPLGRVAATATRVAELPLASGEVAIEERVPDADTDPRTEVGQVGHAFNRMLGHMEQALIARQESEETLRRFVADASHELRTPLASIRGYSELARRDDEVLPEDVRRSLDRIGSESVRMTGLVEDLLLLARLDAGAELRHEPVELARILVDGVSDAHVTGPDHVWELDLDDAAGELVVDGDASRIQQVVVNLLANARSHTPTGTVVTASLAAEPGWAVLRVTDTGPGIDPALRPRLFERFVRGDDSRSRAAGSTGLGLSIVAAIVEAHRGEVSVTSIPGATSFEVRLPRGPAMPG